MIPSKIVSEEINNHHKHGVKNPLTWVIVAIVVFTMIGILI